MRTIPRLDTGAGVRMGVQGALAFPLRATERGKSIHFPLDVGGGWREQHLMGMKGALAFRLRASESDESRDFPPDVGGGWREQPQGLF